MPKSFGPCYNLFLDDLRTTEEVFEYTEDYRYTERSWIIVRNYVEFVETISEKYLEGQLPQLISFDHDLGYEEEVVDMPDPDYSSSKEKNGFHCAQWLIDFCIDKDAALPEYLVHSMNPVGKKNILSLLDSYQCYYCGGKGYHKISCMRNFVDYEKK